MSGDQTAYVMLDANALLHFQRPDQIDWLSMLKSRSVSLLVTPMLLHELEEQKVKNRSRKLRERAQSIVIWIASFMESETALEVRKGVTFTFIRHSPQIDYPTHRLSRTVYDDEIIASAIEFKQEHSCDVRIFTADTGLRLKLPAHGMRAIIPPDDLKLPDEPDEVERENAKLKNELNRHLHRLPRLEFAFLDGTSKFALPAMRAGIDKIKPEPPPQFGSYQYEYKSYVNDLAKWKREARLATGFRVRLENTGNAVATNIKIEISFPNFVLARALRGQPRVPNIMTRDFPLNIPPSNEEAPSYSDHDNKVWFDIADLVHNRAFESELIWLRFANEDMIQNFSAEHLITCVESMEPIRDRLHFTVDEWKS